MNIIIKFKRMSLPPILRSKSFWAVGSVAGLLGLAVWRDQQKAQAILDLNLEQAELLGAAPLSPSQPLRRISLVHFYPATDTGARERQLFRRYAVEILSRAGVDYQWVELDAARLAKVYADKSKGDQNVPVIDSEQIVRPLVEGWMQKMYGQYQVTDHSVFANFKEIIDITPVSDIFFRDGLVALNPDTFKSMTSGIGDFYAKGGKGFAVAGLIDCHVPHYPWYRRWATQLFGREAIARQICPAALAVASESYQPVKLLDDSNAINVYQKPL